jgi:hypothetical protein
MEPVAAPNWLNIVGLCYLLAGFGFLALSAGFHRGVGASAEVRHHITDYGRRILTFAAGITGAIGILFQGLGQFVVVESGTWLVLACLALVPILLAYVFGGDHMVERYRHALELAERQKQPAVYAPAIAPASRPGPSPVIRHAEAVAPLHNAAE